jgi:hypothetical protein
MWLAVIFSHTPLVPDAFLDPDSSTISLFEVSWPYEMSLRALTFDTLRHDTIREDWLDRFD